MPSSPATVFPNGFDASSPMGTPGIQATAYIYIYNPILSGETFGFPNVESSNLPYTNYASVSATAIPYPATPNLPTGTVPYTPYNLGGDQATDITDVFINPIL